MAAVAAAATAEPVDAQTVALVDGAKSALGALAFVALGVSSQGQHDFTEMLTILTLVRGGWRGVWGWGVMHKSDKFMCSYVKTTAK